MLAKRTVPLVTCLALAASCSQGSTGTVVGKILPGGFHAEGVQVGGKVRAINGRGNVVATVDSSGTNGFRLRLRPGSYQLVSSVDGVPCRATVVVQAGKTSKTNVKCVAK